MHNYSHEIGYAGTKDKNAWTCQKISIYNAKIDLIKNFSHPGILLKNFKWAKHKIKIGDLSGNNFKIVLRDADKDAIKVLNKAKNTRLMPNFFGNQRFGSLRNDNVSIAKLIFQQKYEEAVFKFLIGYGEDENMEVKNAKIRLKKDKNIQAAKNYFPPVLKKENMIINYLINNDDNWVGALNVIDQKSLLIVCQSLQSKLFNEILQRIIDEKIKLDDNVSLPMLGYDSAFSLGRIGEIEKEVLRNNGLNLKDFKNIKLPNLGLRSSKRKAFFIVKWIDMEIMEDELFDKGKKIILTFQLDSGSYATTLLDQFFICRELHLNKTSHLRDKTKEA